MSDSKLYTLSPETTLNVVSSGPRSRLTLIFLHFWGGSSRTFSTTIAHLTRFKSKAVDFRAWGSSTGPQRADAYSIKDLAQDVEELIPKLDVQDFILIGHSMGGKVAQLVAGRRLVKGLKGVILIGPAPPTPFELPDDMKKQQMAAYSSYESAEFVARNVLTSSTLSDEMVAILVEDMVKGSEFSKLAWPNYAMAEDIVVESRHINVPVLVIAGELDRIEPLDRLKTEVRRLVIKEIRKGLLDSITCQAKPFDNLENFYKQTIVFTDR
jgi:3-oxoadipate enol-lactonase